MSDAHFVERNHRIEKDKVRMEKWLQPPISDRLVLLRDLVKTVNNILLYLSEINETLSDDDGLLDCLAEDLREFEHLSGKPKPSSTNRR